MAARLFRNRPSSLECAALPGFAGHAPACRRGSRSSFRAAREQGIMFAMDLARIRALIFDLDGTLIDSERDLIDATNATLRHLGRAELPPGTVSGYIGHGAAKLVASALGPAGDRELHAALEFFLDYYQDHKLAHTRTYPGVPEALDSLAAMPMAVLTNKPQEISAQILEALAIAKYFRVIYGGDSLAAKKPDPAGVYKILEQFKLSPEKALFIGDSEVDVQTARNAGTFCAIVNYGFGKNDRAAFPADLYIDKLSDLVPLVRLPPF
ncbi:MAG: HAD-IA family hydrolase [Candidatus Acidiferrum sp.]